MAIPIAVAGADQGGGVFVPVAEFAYSGSSFNVPLSDNGSYDPDAGSIVAWQWTLLYKPPGSTASILNPTSSTPTLQNVDVVGTYRIFLEVTDDNIPPESSEPNQYLAPDSAFCKVVHKTQVHDWRIPATSERDWADVVYELWLDIDTYLPAISQWDVTHQLFFTSGNTAQIKDNRTAGSKSGEALLWLNTDDPPDFAAGEYIGLQVTPGLQQGAGDGTVGVNVEEADHGYRVKDPWLGRGYVARYEEDPAVLTATNEAFGMEQTHPDHEGGVMLWFNNTQPALIGTQLYVKSGKAAVSSTWGSVVPIWSPAYTPFFFGGPRLFLEELTFDHRITAPDYLYGGAIGKDNGTIKWFIDAETTSAPQAQDIVLGRVVRQKPVADETGEDFGIVWRESVAELDAGPPDPDIYPERTLLMRRPDTQEWSFLGVQRDRTAAPSTPVPFERPGWVQGRQSNVNPGSDGIKQLVFDIALPSSVTIDISEGGGECNARLERPLTEWAIDAEDFTVSTLLVTAPSDAVRVSVKYSEPFETRSGQATLSTPAPTNGTPYKGTVTLSPSMKVGPAWADTLSIQLTPYMDGSIVPPAGDIPIISVDEVTVDGSNNLTSFTYILQPKDDDHAIQTTQKLFWQIQVEKLFYITDVISEVHWSALVTVAE